MNQITKACFITFTWFHTFFCFMLLSLFLLLVLLLKSLNLNLLKTSSTLTVKVASAWWQEWLSEKCHRCKIKSPKIITLFEDCFSRPVYSQKQCISSSQISNVPFDVWQRGGTCFFSLPWCSGCDSQTEAERQLNREEGTDRCEQERPWETTYTASGSREI